MRLEVPQRLPNRAGLVVVNVAERLRRDNPQPNAVARYVIIPGRIVANRRDNPEPRPVSAVRNGKKHLPRYVIVLTIGGVARDISPGNRLEAIAASPVDVNSRDQIATGPRARRDRNPGVCPAFRVNET